MADIVRLAIVYDTADAAAKIGALDNRLDRVQGSSRSASLAAVRLGQSLAQGNVSAVSLTRTLETLAGPTLGGFAIGLGIAVGALALLFRHQDDLRTKTAAFTKELDTARDAVDKLLGIPKTDTEQGIINLTRRLKELQTEINKPTWWDRLQNIWGHLKAEWMGTEGTGQAFRGIGAGTAPGVIPPSSPAAAARDELDRLLRALLERQRHDIEGTVQGQMWSTTQSGQAIPLSMQGVGGARGAAPEHILNMKYWDEQAKAAEEAAQHASTLSDALWSMSDALEHFVTTGTLEFQKMLDNILSSFFRAAAATVIKDILHKAFPTLPTFQEGGIVPGMGPQLAVVHGGEEIIPAGHSASVATSVTFNVQAMDSQSIVSFFQQNGGTIAAEISRQADRSRALRRRFTR